MMMTGEEHQVLVEFVRYGDRGSLWRAWLYSPSGKILLVERSRDPEHDAARAMLKLGYRGRFHVVDMVTRARRMTGDVEKAAQYAVQESVKGGPRIVKWRPRPDGIGEAEDPEAA